MTYILADFSVLCWKLYTQYEGISLAYTKRARLKMGTLLWAKLINGGTDMGLTDYRIAFALDIKNCTGGYWRTQAMEGYKGGRSRKPELFEELYELGIDYCIQSGFSLIGERNFEADDIAGLFARATQDTPEVIKYLWSVDRDWTQLVDGSNSLWFYNTRVPKETEPCQERLVTNEGVAKHTLWKYNEPISHPRELLDVKVAYGDAGDKVKAGEENRRFMDLLNPDSEFNIDEKRPNLLSFFRKDIFEPSNIRLDHLEKAKRILG